jgi:hypothetical protein
MLPFYLLDQYRTQLEHLKKEINMIDCPIQLYKRRNHLKPCNRTFMPPFCSNDDYECDPLLKLSCREGCTIWLKAKDKFSEEVTEIIIAIYSIIAQRTRGRIMY